MSRVLQKSLVISNRFIAVLIVYYSRILLSSVEWILMWYLILSLCWLWTRCDWSSVCGVWTHRPISWRICRRPAYQRRAAACCRSSTWPTTTWPTGVCRSWPDTHTCGSCTWPTTTCTPSQPGNSMIQSLLWTLCLAQAGKSWQTYVLTSAHREYYY